MADSKFSAEIIARREHEEATKSKRVNIVDTEMAVELDANDGDSVATKAMVQTLTVDADEAFSVAGWSKMAYYATANNMVLQLSPDTDGNEWYDAGTVSSSEIKEVCAMRAKFSGACKVVLKGN
jgi:hypothetical protein